MGLKTETFGKNELKKQSEFWEHVKVWNFLPHFLNIQLSTVSQNSSYSIPACFISLNAISLYSLLLCVCELYVSTQFLGTIIFVFKLCSLNSF